MYTIVLSDKKAKLENDKNKVENCLKILKSLPINTRYIEEFLIGQEQKISKINDKIKQFENSEKRTDVATIRFYIKNCYGDMETKDFNKISNIMQTFEKAPYLNLCNTDVYQFRTVCVISSKQLSEYECNIIIEYTMNDSSLKKDIENNSFEWDGYTLSITNKL